jgi:conjugative transposon TraK protein
MIIEKLETKIKLAGFISFISILASCIIAISSFFMATIMVREERKKIYVLDGDVPLSATHTPQEINIEIEAKAHIQSFHSYFFTLPPDDEYINYTLEKAMYLIDESGLKQKNALQEKGFYAGIMAQSENHSISSFIGCFVIEFPKQRTCSGSLTLCGCWQAINNPPQIAANSIFFIYKIL